MSRQAWQERIVGERMQMDDRFSDRVTASPLSRQQWGLVMTAVEFRIEHADDPDRASLVADTGNLRHVMSEMETIDRQVGAMTPGGGAGAGERRGGILSTVKGALGLGGGGGGDADEALREAAEDLAREYADGLQSLLRERGRWDEIREMAAAQE